MSNSLAASLEIFAAFLAAADILLGNERVKHRLRLFLVWVIGIVLFLISIAFSMFLLSVAMLFWRVSEGWTTGFLSIVLIAWILLGGKVRDWFADRTVIRPIDWVLNTSRPRLFAWLGFLIFVAIQIAK